MDAIVSKISDLNICWWKWSIAGVAGIGVLLIKRRMSGKVFHSSVLMTGKTVIITGANCGIGKTTALELAKRQARVILACRDTEKGEAAVKDIRRKTKEGELVVMNLDLASLASVRKFVEAVSGEKKIDVLINNAGVYQCPYTLTEDGFETQMGVNYLGHFYLNYLLLDKLKESVPCRIVMVSSGLQVLGKIDFENLNSQKSYDKKLAYYNSKLAMCLFARELAERVQGSGICVYSLHPGMVLTNLARHVPMPFLLKLVAYPLAWLLVKSPFAGCQTVLYCSIAEELEGDNDNYYGNCEKEPWPENLQDKDLVKKLWEVSEKLTGLV